jgi:hypothetical protein
MRSDQTELTLGTWDERKQPPPVIKHGKTDSDLSAPLPHVKI